MRLTVRWFGMSVLCIAGLACWSTSASQAASRAAGVSEASAATSGSGASPFGGPLAVSGIGLLDGGQAALNAAEARRASPEAFWARELSQTAFEHLTAGQAKALALKAFPRLVAEPAGGPPRLPAGERILGYPADNVAQVALSTGAPGSPSKRGVIESLEPIALEVSPGHHAPVDLGLRETSEAFRPSFPVVAVQIPKRLSEGVALSRVGVSLTPVDAGGSFVGGSPGEADGAGVVYANTSRDSDTFAKPNTFGFSVETLLRSVDSPRQLFFRVGMPAGARLAWAKHGSGALDVIADGDTIATVPRPRAQDAEGTPVPVSIGLVSGDVLTVTVAPVVGFRLPVAVDPEVQDSIWQNELYFSTYYRTNWEFQRGPYPEGQAFTAPQHPEGGSWTESIAGSHNGSETGGLFYTTRGASQITLAHAEGHWNDTGSNIQNYMVLYTPKSPYTEDYDALPVATEEGRGWGGYACAPALNCPETVAGPAPPENNNTVAYQQESTAPGGGVGGSNTITKAYVDISQEQSPELSFNKTSPTVYNSLTNEYVPNVLYGSGGWLGPHSGAFEVNASDPGIGLSYFRVLGSGWGKEHSYYALGECIGVQCPPATNEKFLYNNKMKDGEEGLEALADDKVGLYAHIEAGSQKIKVDGTPPHNIKVNGLQNGNELPLGEAHLKIEATDGEGLTHSSGVKSIKATVDGQEVAGSPASCPEGPCTANTELTLAARDFTSGQHSLVVTATDNVNNVVQEEFTFRVHGATPISVGPASVDPSSGQLTLSTNDVSLGGAAGVSRTFQSRNLTAGTGGPLGPQWAINLGGDENLTVLLNGSAVLNASDGASTTFTRNKEGEFKAPQGDSSLKLEAKEKEPGKGISEYVLSDATGGTKTKFEQPPGTQSTTPTFANQFGSEPSQLSRPVSDAVDPSGNVWATSYGSNVVEKLSSTGALLASYGSYGTEGGQLSSPWGIAVDPRNGNVYVSDQGNSRIEQFSSSGAFTKAFGWGVSDGKSEFEICTSKCQAGIAGSANGQFNTLAGVTVDSTGNLWVADFGNNRIQEFNEKGEYITKFGSAGKEPSQLEGPLNIALSGGNLYITDSRNNRVQEFSTSGTPIARFGAAGSENGKFSGPYGIVSDPRTGNLYVGDSGNRRVQEFTSAGAFVTMFGASGAGQFTSPAGVAVNSVGSVYVVDYGANQVEEWTRSTWVPTEAGGALAASTTTYAYTTVEVEGKAVIQPTEALAPIPTGVSSCTPLARGCRALTFNYASTTTATGENESEWGDFKGHLTRVYFHAWDPAKGAMSEPEVVRYLYDKQGRLRAEWDPRISPALKTRYGYDPEGHVTAITPPGQASWGLIYGTTAGSPNTGRLLKMTRPATLWNGSPVENTERPTLSGEQNVGVTLGVSNGKWNGSPIAYSYQWDDCNATETECVPISGATNSTYKVAQSDISHVVVAFITATNGGGSSSAKSLRKEIQSIAFTKYELPSESYPSGITTGADGNMWFTTYKHKIAKITTSGAITEYAVPTGKANRIASGSDGNLWFTEWEGDAIGRSTTSGAITLYSLPTGSGASGITNGPDGNLWFTEASRNKIGKITTAGIVTEYPLPTNSSSYQITAGPDGNLWFTDVGTSKVGKVTTSGVITEYSLPVGSHPYGITAGSDGKLWVAENGTGKIAKISTSGAITEYPLPTGHAPYGITAGPEGALWFSDENASEGYVGRVTTSGVVTESTVPGSQLAQLTRGPEGDLWLADAWWIGKLNGYSEQGIGASVAPGWTLEYGVPLSGGGLPNLSEGEAAKWGQKDVPVEGAAVIPPDEPMGWPASTYRRATIHYFDHEGRLVDTASPGGAVATSEYNSTNDVVRTLSADNRAAALKEGGKSAEVAERLDTKSTYSTDGTELLETVGPEHKARLASGSEVQARNHVKYSYDEGAPEGKHYGLVTKTTDAAQYAGKEEDPRTTTTSYSGAASCEGVEVSGWTLRKPTSVTTDPGGLALTDSTVYDPCTGNVLETTSPTGSATNPIPTFLSSFGSSGSGEGQFQSPLTIAVNQKNGNSYVTDVGNTTHPLQQFSPTGKFLASLGTLGSGTGQTKEPSAIAVDTSGNIWVGDSGNSRVEEFNEKGEYVRAFGAAGTGNGQFQGAIGGIAISGTSVWVSDQSGNRVERFSTSGNYLSTFGAEGSANGQFSNPNGITITGGHIYVADSSNHRVQEFSTAGKYVAQFGSQGTGNGQIERPLGITADPQSGDLYVSDYESGRVEEFTASGAFVAWLGSYGTGNGQFKNPNGVATSSSGNLYVVDSAEAENPRIDVWAPGYAGSHTTQTIYYSAKANPKYPTCGKHPEWIALACQTQPAAQPGAEPSLPVSTFAYNIWDEVEATTEKFGSTTRVKAETYDGAGRSLTSETTSSIDAPLPKVTNKYNEQTGVLELQSTGVGEAVKRISSITNKLGQLESYTDADGNTAKYTYDVDGRIEEVSEGKGEEASSHQAYVYDATTGAMTKLVDSAAGTFTASYDAEGKMSSETYPNGMSATYGHDSTGQATSIEYVKNAHCATKCPETWFSDSTVAAVHGETLAQTSTLAKDSYAYDHAGRLSEAQEEPAGKPCVSRLYNYDEEANRTSLTTREGSQGKCATEGGSTEHHTYDAANRLNDSGVSYEAFGNITNLPALDAGKYEITSTYYVDNQLQSQTQNSKTSTYAYDPAGRIRETSSSSKTAINHYAGVGEALTWTSEGAGTWTRNIPGIDGTLCATQANGGAITLQLHDLQGNIVATAALSETETKLLSTYNSTEFGVPQPGTTPPKYAWLGASGLATEASSPGISSKGGASYIPLIGRALQTQSIASPGAFPDGTVPASVVQASYLQAAASTLKAIAIEHQAAEEAANRQKAEEEAARNQCPASECHVDGPGEGNCEANCVTEVPSPTEGGAEGGNEGDGATIASASCTKHWKLHEPTNYSAKIELAGALQCQQAVNIEQELCIFSQAPGSGKWGKVGCANAVIYHSKGELLFTLASCTPGYLYTGWLWARVFNSGAQDHVFGTDSLSSHQKFRCEGYTNYGPGL